nr:Rne/Rng family ribonuclease [Alkalibacter mobilis]
MGQNRIAVVGDEKPGQIDYFFTERESDWNSYGEIHMGRVEQIKPGMQVAFVNFGAEKNGLLHVSDIHGNYEKMPVEKLLKSGQEIIVQIKKEAVGTKGARLTTKYWLPGHYTVLLPTDDRVYVSKKIRRKDVSENLKEFAESVIPEGMGLILRTEAKDGTHEVIQKEIEYLCSKWRNINRNIHMAPKLLYKDRGPVINAIRDYYTVNTEEIVLNSEVYLEDIREYFKFYFPEDIHKIRMAGKLNIFEELNLEKQINELYARKVWLKSGGYIIIDHTEAFHVIDVNSGKFTGGKDPEETVLKINLEATETIADQMRLRNLSGIILIDYINIESEEAKKAIIKKWHQMLKRDKVRFKVVGFTELSILQITRKQQGKSIANINRHICPVCNGTGEIYNQEAFFYKCLSKLESDMELLEHNIFKILISPHLKAVMDDIEYFGTGLTFNRMLEDFYGVKVNLEVDINNEFDQILILPQID